MSLIITDRQIKQYHEDGYFILEKAIPDEHLEILRNECSYFIGYADAQMDSAKTTSLGLNHRGSRYFVQDAVQAKRELEAFVFSPLMAQICKATIGDEAYLFWNQYVVKGAEVGMKFAWHQDSGYVGNKHAPYLSCWCPLDDVNEENGTVYILPYARAGVREMVNHVREEGSNDLVGYHGEDPGIPVNVPAGSIAVFSSVTFHRSGPNTTKKMRRVYLPQYSASPLLKDDGVSLWGTAMPFLKNGEIVVRD